MLSRGNSYFLVNISQKGWLPKRELLLPSAFCNSWSHGRQFLKFLMQLYEFLRINGLCKHNFLKVCFLGKQEKMRMRKWENFLLGKVSRFSIFRAWPGILRAIFLLSDWIYTRSCYGNWKKKNIVYNFSLTVFKPSENVKFHFWLGHKLLGESLV